jgi:hypothetical protein
MHSHSFIDMLANAFMRSAVYHAVGALVRGHSLVVTLAICAAIIGGVWLIKSRRTS